MEDDLVGVKLGLKEVGDVEGTNDGALDGTLIGSIDGTVVDLALGE